MKNVILVVLAIMTMLFLGMGNVNAQEKSSVIITGRTFTGGRTYRIEIVKPNYEVEVRELNFKEDNFFSFMKKEMDHWISQNYMLKEVIYTPLEAGDHSTLFVLIKE